MKGLTIYEFDGPAAVGANFSGIDGVHPVPVSVFGWLEELCLRAADAGDTAWLRWAQRRGRRVIQVTSIVGVIRAPDGYQLEVLPNSQSASIVRR